MEPSPNPEQPFNGAFINPEFLQDHRVFHYAEMYQQELNDFVCSDNDEATNLALEKVGVLDKIAKEAGLFNEIASLSGPNVVVPITDFDHITGSFTIQIRNADDVYQEMPETFGEFYGFTPYASPILTTHDRFVPTLGIQVKLRAIGTPNFIGHLFAFGPVATTSINFMHDDLKRV